MLADGGGAMQITRQGGFAPALSPDGKWVYYTKTRSAVAPVWRVPRDGGTEEEVLKGAVNRSFVPTSTGVYFFSSESDGQLSNLQFLDFKTGRIKIIAHIPKPVQTGLTISPDGRTLLYSQIDQDGSEIMLAENFR
jgi:Tol biopolymer transport system component